MGCIISLICSANLDLKTERAVTAYVWRSLASSVPKFPLSPIELCNEMDIIARRDSWVIRPTTSTGDKSWDSENQAQNKAIHMRATV